CGCSSTKRSSALASPHACRERERHGRARRAARPGVTADVVRRAHVAAVGLDVDRLGMAVARDLEQPRVALLELVAIEIAVGRLLHAVDVPLIVDSEQLAA